MLIPMRDCTAEWNFRGIGEFVKEFKLEKNIEDWYGISDPVDILDLLDFNKDPMFDCDQDIIEDILKRLDEVYSIEFIDDKYDGYWVIREHNITIYDEEDMETDIAWLESYNMDTKEATEFVTNLVKKEMMDK